MQNSLLMQFLRCARRLLAPFIILGCATAAPAAGFQAGYVTKLVYLNSGGVLIYLSGPITGQPACATAARFAVDSNSAAGKAMIEQFISLYNNRQQAVLQGVGTCTIWGDSEDVAVLWTPAI